MVGKSKFAIIGATGMLGTALRKKFPNALLLDKKGGVKGIEKVDLTNLGSLEYRLSRFGKGDWVINAAAYTEVDIIETENGEKLSKRANVEGPYVLASLAFRKGFKIAHFSTAYVFSGIKGIYMEGDMASPQNTYGKHKLEGERPIIGSGGVVLRTDGLYGSGGSKRNFIDSIVEKVNIAPSIKMVNDQIGSPTFTKDLAEMTLAVIQSKDAQGIYHAVNSGKCSRVELTQKVIDLLEADCGVKEISTKEYNKTARNGLITAKRPKDCSLSINKISRIYKPRSWDAALADYLGV